MNNPKKTEPRFSNKMKLIVGLVVIALSSSAVTFLISKGVGSNKVTTARDIGMASDSCEERISDEFEDTLINQHYDDISSRYEPAKRQYIVYYRVTSSTIVDELPTVKTQLAKCVIWERLGYVSSFEVIDI